MNKINSLKSVIETDLLPYVERPMRYAGGELNSVVKDLSQVSLHGVLCFPDLYDIGMSHTGIQILYHCINQHESWALSRCFHPWTDAEALMRKANIPLYSLEYFTSLKDADFVGFSVQYELQYTNIINMLDLAGIPIWRNQRTVADPYIIAGGPCVGNPEPLADVIDAFVIGDGEIAMVSIAKLLEAAKNGGFSRSDVFKQLSEIDGVYVPELYPVGKNRFFTLPLSETSEKVRAAKIPELDDAFYPEKPVVPLIEVVHKRLAVEVMRGCTRGCRFCSAGIYYRPVRERTPQSVTRQIKKGVSTTGWEEVGLLSLSTADYSALSPLLGLLQTLGSEFPVSCSLPSTRLDALSAEQLNLLEKVSPIQTFTIAPEAGSERLRRVINKDFTDDVIYDAVAELMRRNVQTLKLYFMLGLPTENDDDIEAIITMIVTISGKVRAASGRRMLNVSLSPFSPKPHTPFQREAMERPESLLEKGMYIKRTLKHLKNVKISYRDPDQTLLETLMARGDREVGRLVHEAWRRGARFDGWDECFDIKRWMDAASDLQINVQPFCAEIPVDVELPWNRITTGVSDEFLENERQRAIDAAATHDCRTGSCLTCGVCHASLQPAIKSAVAEDDLSVNNEISGAKNNSSEISHTGALATHVYRFYYRKTGVIRFLGHLDMVAVIHRAARMAHFPLAYTNGFNPHPRIAFGPPLPFGVSGACEAFDAALTDSFKQDPMIMNTWLPKGLEVFSMKEIDLKTESLNAAVASAEYWFDVTLDPLHRKHLDELICKNEVVINAVKKGVPVQKNIRPGILHVSLRDDHTISAVLKMAGDGSCKPLEFISALAPELSISSVPTTRIACFDKNGKVL